MVIVPWHPYRQDFRDAFCGNACWIGRQREDLHTTRAGGDPTSTQTYLQTSSLRRGTRAEDTRVSSERVRPSGYARLATRACSWSLGAGCRRCAHNCCGEHDAEPPPRSFRKKIAPSSAEYLAVCSPTFHATSAYTSYSLFLRDRRFSLFNQPLIRRTVVANELRPGRRTHDFILRVLFFRVRLTERITNKSEQLSNRARQKLSRRMSCWNVSEIFGMRCTSL